MLICPKCSKPMEHSSSMHGDYCPSCKHFRPDKDKVEILARILCNTLKKMDANIFKEELEEINLFWGELKIEEKKKRGRKLRKE